MKLNLTYLEWQKSRKPARSQRAVVRVFRKASFLFLIYFLLSLNSSAQPVAQSDFFNVLQSTCSNYLDVTANDDLDTLLPLQVQIIDSPGHGSAFPNGGYLSYCPHPSFQGADQFTYSVTIDSFSTIATVYINVLPPNNSVNPGDADQNGTVEHFDVLSIGLTYGTLGPSRSDSNSSSLAWSPLSFINSDPGAADCNGDGIVNDVDLSVIENNFLDTYSVLHPYAVDTSQCSGDGIPLFIESLSGDSILDGDTLVLSIKLGDGNTQSEAYGIAFTLEFDNRFIGGSQVQFSTANSWLVQNDSPLFFKKDFQSSGEIEVALTRTNHIGVTGTGEITQLIVPIDDNIDGIAVGPGWHDLLLNLKAIRLISEYDIAQDVCVRQPEIMVSKSATSLKQLIAKTIRLYPNPNDGSMAIEGEDLREIIVTDLVGKEIFKSQYEGERKVMINLRDVGAGSYLTTVKTRYNFFVQKISIQH